MNGLGSEGIIYWLHLECTGGDVIYTAGFVQCPLAPLLATSQKGNQVPGSLLGTVCLC